MASRRVEALISPIARLAEACARRKIPVVAFADAHAPDSLEFASFPPHCLRGTAEAALCPEIAQAAPVTLLEKSSTNGFVEPVFDFWRRDNAHIDTYLVAGDCTDICVQQFVVTALTHGIARNRPLRIVVPLALVDTYDGDGIRPTCSTLFPVYHAGRGGRALRGYRVGETVMTPLDGVDCMPSNEPLFASENLTMLTDFYELTMANGFFQTGNVDKIAYFDMFFRRIPMGAASPSWRASSNWWIT